MDNISKHKTSSSKKLIIEDDEPQEDGDELNPFSFKEFIRSKNQHTISTTGDNEGKNHLTKKKTYGGAYLVEEDYCPPKSLDLDHQGHFFTDPTPITQCLENETEVWAGSYQPSAIEEAHELGLCRTLDSSTYSGQSVLSIVEKDETAACLWQLDEGCSPEAQLPRRSTGSYEGDEETSMADLTYQPVKHSAEIGTRDQQKLREDNAQLRKHIKELLMKSETDSIRVRHLTDELHNRRVQEERDAKALETMVHSVEQNLQLMTKRAVKAENSVSKLKQELHQLQGQVEGYRCENERLRAAETVALKTMKHNAQMASEYLNKAAHDAETSIKQLLRGTDTLYFASQLLSSIDKITEIHK